jgi:hypothetical protein
MEKKPQNFACIGSYWGGEVGVSVQTRLTIIEEDQQKDPKTSRGDVLIFPDMVKYK